METSKKIDSKLMTNTIPESRAEQSRAEQGNYCSRWIRDIGKA